MALSLPKTGLPLVDRALLLVEAAFNALLGRVPLVRTKTETFAAANTDQLIRHGLGYPVTGYRVVRKDIAGDVYDGSAVPAPYETTEWIQLKCTTLARVTLEFY